MTAIGLFLILLSVVGYEFAQPPFDPKVWDWRDVVVAMLALAGIVMTAIGLLVFIWRTMP